MNGQVSWLQWALGFLIVALMSLLGVLYSQQNARISELILTMQKARAELDTGFEVEKRRSLDQDRALEQRLLTSVRQLKTVLRYHSRTFELMNPPNYDPRRYQEWLDE